MRAFCGMIHAAAARALKGAVDPGALQLDFLHPGGGSMVSTRFPIGAVEEMADSAISAAEGGLNVYVEGRTIDVRASAGRGRTNATRGVFAFVSDSDSDKGKAGSLPIAPTWSVESSPGNSHDWLLLERALTAAEAEPLGRALRKRIGSDSATAKLTQPYRVAGTPNYPSPKKMARGRTMCATRVLSADGPLYTAAQLAEVAPPVEEPDAKASASSAGRSGATSGAFDELIAEEGEDRSGRFFDAIRAAHRAGLLRGDVEDAMRRHPGGCAGKYLKPYDRLAEEIVRAWAKVEARADEAAEAAAEGVEPTFPDHSVPVAEARAAVRAALRTHLAAGQGVRAVRVSTGVGKTRIAAELVAETDDGFGKVRVVRTHGLKPVLERFSAVWRAAKDLLQEGEGAVSGRLVLVEKDTEDGFGKTRAVLTHGIRSVLDRWADLPVLILDATLPGVEVLRRFFPGVEVAADIEAEARHATVRQVLGAPTSSGKLFRSEAGRRREEVRRAILHRFVELGRPSTLVVCQLELEAFLLSAGLPEGIAVGHFNAIAGLDAYKGVGLLIVVGRTMPNVMEVETYAGALSGLEPLRTAEPAKGARFHDRVPLALRMADGTGRAVEGYRHPDPLAEAARWQICEAGVLQAIGRARAVNRTSADPVRIDVWSDLALPLTVDEAVAWDGLPAGREADMVADGMALESAPDMAACWPAAWPDSRAAENWRQRSTGTHSPIETFLYRGMSACEASTGRPAPFRYQHPGARQRWRLGWYLPGLVADPCAWLESRLGVVLARFEYLPDAEDEAGHPAAGESADTHDQDGGTS